MIYVYPIENEQRLNYYRNYKDISENVNDFRLCIARERWQEMEYFINRHDIIFWNSKTHTFTESDFSPCLRDFSHSIIFPRTSVPQYPIMTADIIAKGWTPISKPCDYYAIERWMYYLPNKYLGRKIVTGTKESISNNFDFYYDQVKDDKGRFFIKSVSKDWSYDGSKEGWFDTGMALSLKAGEMDDQIMLSEWMELEEDEENTIEYRCFVIHGKLVSISRYTDYETALPSQEAVDYANQLVDELVGKYLPLSVVIDIAKVGDEYILLECNDVCSSGRYAGNIVESLNG